MSTPEPDSRIQELQRDLGDGDDLSKAMELIGDVLNRRIQRAQRSLEELNEIAEDIDTDDLHAIVRHVETTLDRYGTALRRGHEQLQTVIDDFQDALGQEIEALEAYGAD